MNLTAKKCKWIACALIAMSGITQSMIAHAQEVKAQSINDHEGGTSSGGGGNYTSFDTEVVLDSPEKDFRIKFTPWLLKTEYMGVGDTEYHECSVFKGDEQGNEIVPVDGKIHVDMTKNASTRKHGDKVQTVGSSGYYVYCGNKKFMLAATILRRNWCSLGNLGSTYFDMYLFDLLELDDSKNFKKIIFKFTQDTLVSVIDPSPVSKGWTSNLNFYLNKTTGLLSHKENEESFRILSTLAPIED